MFSLVFAEIFQGFKRLWKLYAANISVILLIIFLFAYLDGSRRQLNMQKSAFAGEVVAQFKTEIPDVRNTLLKNISNISTVSEKIRGYAQAFSSGSTGSENVELIGIRFDSDKVMLDYLTLVAGHLPEKDSEILIPTSLLKKMDVKVGDSLRVMGKTSAGVYNASVYKVSGIYNSPSLSLFGTSRLLIPYSAMEEYFQPQQKDREFCLFFSDGQIPESINLNIREAIADTNHEMIEKVEIMTVSAMNILDIAVQFNVFLVIIIVLTMIILVSVVALVNFNVYMILYRSRRKEIGTLMSFGVNPWKIGLSLWLESLLQVAISTIVAFVLCFILALAGRFIQVGGFMEILFVLLSGTNRIDLFLQFYQVQNAFIIVMSAVTVSQVPLFLQIVFKNPLKVMTGK